MSKTKGLNIKYEWYEMIKILKPSDFKELIISMLLYRQYGTEPPEFSGVTQIVANEIRKSIQRTIKNEEAGHNGGNPHLKSAKAKPYTGESADTSLFDRFWAAYPKKVGKEYAKKCFLRLKVDEALLNKMIDALAVQKQTDDWQRDGGRFIPNPSTWLNQGRWQDEGITVEKKKSIYDQFDLGVEL